MEKSFSKATLVLLFLSILTLAAIIMPIAKAQSMSVTLTPSEGPVGTQVIVEITNFPSTDYTFSVTFGTSNVGTIDTGPAYNTASTIFYVPTVSLDKYTVTVTGSEGEVATTTFTVTQAPSTTPTAAPTGSTGSTGFSPTNVPVTVSSSGFWSPLAIAITAVVIAFAIFMTAVYVIRGKQKPLPYREDSAYEPRPSTPSKNPNSPSNINQPYQPYQPSKINQPATNIQKPPFTRVCKHCKRTVRDDLNICPYCSKRLR
jgi:hypothetical protein